MKLPKQDNCIQHCIAIILITIAIGLSACNSAEERKEAEPNEIGSESQLTDTRETANRQQEQEQKYVVPGINFEPPPDDALADGWQTEQLSDNAAKQLNRLAKFLSPDAEKPTPVSSIVAESVSFDLLRPAETKTVFEDSAFLIRRRDPESTGLSRLTGEADFEAQLKKMLSFVDDPRDVSTKVKVFKVEHLGELLSTSAYMQTWGIPIREPFSQMRPGIASGK